MAVGGMDAPAKIAYCYGWGRRRGSLVKIRGLTRTRNFSIRTCLMLICRLAKCF